MPEGIKDKVAIIGMGCTRFGEHWDKSGEDLMVESYKEALEDAGIEAKAIQAAWRCSTNCGSDTWCLVEPFSIGFSQVWIVYVINVVLTDLQGFCKLDVVFHISGAEIGHLFLGASLGTIILGQYGVHHCLWFVTGDIDTGGVYGLAHLLDNTAQHVSRVQRRSDDSARFLQSDLLFQSPPRLSLGCAQRLFRPLALADLNLQRFIGSYQFRRPFLNPYF